MNPADDSSSVLAWLSARIARLGRAQMMLWLTALSIACSVAAGATTLILWVGTAQEWRILMSLCVLVPCLVSPPLGWVAATLSIEAEAAQRLAERLALTDPLTGLTNRRYFVEAAEREFARALRSGEPLVALLLDIDHFKSVNDTHGHATGDEVLVQVARACAGCMREDDVLARYGGEEFVALLPGTPPDAAVALAQALRAAVAALAVAAPHGATVRPTLSVGVALLAPGDSAVGRLVDRADQAMYAAKQAGRNRVGLSPEVTRAAS